MDESQTARNVSPERDQISESGSAQIRTRCVRSLPVSNCPRPSHLPLSLYFSDCVVTLASASWPPICGSLQEVQAQAIRGSPARGSPFRGSPAREDTPAGQELSLSTAEEYSQRMDFLMSETARLEAEKIVLAEERRQALLRGHREILDQSPQCGSPSRALLPHSAPDGSPPAAHAHRAQPPTARPAARPTLSSPARAGPTAVAVAAQGGPGRARAPSFAGSDGPAQEPAPAAPEARSRSASLTRTDSSGGTWSLSPAMPQSYMLSNGSSPLPQQVAPSPAPADVPRPTGFEQDAAVAAESEIYIPPVYQAAIAAVERFGWGEIHTGEPEWTALHWAASEGHADLCVRLLKAAADPMQPDHAGNSALEYAQEADDPAAFHVLAQACEARNLGFRSEGQARPSRRPQPPSCPNR